LSKLIFILLSQTADRLNRFVALLHAIPSLLNQKQTSRMKKLIVAISMIMAVITARAQSTGTLSYHDLLFREGANTVPIDKAQAIRFEKLGDKFMNVLAIDAEGVKTKLFPVSSKELKLSLPAHNEQPVAGFATADKSIYMYIFRSAVTDSNRYNAAIYCRPLLAKQ